MYAHMSTGAWGSQGGRQIPGERCYFLGQVLRAVVSSWIWSLRMPLEFFVRAIRALDHKAIYLLQPHDLAFSDEFECP